MPKKHLREIDILRGIAIIAVVLIHVLNTPIRNLSLSIPNNFFYYWQSLLNFAVPCFFLISAIMVTYSAGMGKINWRVFYRKKLLKIGLPYLIWSLLYLAARTLTGELTFISFLSPANWGAWLLTGRSYTHLYFLALLIQFYILLPPLLWAARKTADKPFMALLSAISCQMLVYSIFILAALILLPAIFGI